MLVPNLTGTSRISLLLHFGHQTYGTVTNAGMISFLAKMLRDHFNGNVALVGTLDEMVPQNLFAMVRNTVKIFNVYFHNQNRSCSFNVENWLKYDLFFLT